MLLFGVMLMGAATYVIVSAPAITRIQQPRLRQDRRGPLLGGLRAHVSDSSIDPRLRAFVPAAALAVVLMFVLGGILGFLGGLAAGALLYRLLRRKPDVRMTSHDQPALVDLLAATLSAGAAPVDALQWVGRSWNGSLGDDLVRVSTALRWGASMDEAWTHVQFPQMWESAREAFTRSARTGAPIVDILASCARELRREHRERVEVAAQSAGVRVVLPLALCFLPAYLLWGIVPIVMSWGAGVIP